MSRSAPQTCSAGTERRPAGKTARRANTVAHVVVEELDAPVDRLPKGLLAGRQVAWPAGEDAQPRVEPLQKHARRQRSDARRGELDRERQPVDAAADLPHVRARSSRVELEARIEEPRALREELDGGVLVERGDRDDVLPGDVEDRTARDEEREPRHARATSSA